MTGQSIEMTYDHVLVEAFEHSQCLGHICSTLLQGGVCFVDTTFSNLKWPAELCHQYFVPSKAPLTSIACEKDLVVTEQSFSWPTQADYILTNREDLEAALFYIQDKLSFLLAARGKVNLNGYPWRPGLFLDRDGIVIQYAEYIKDPREVQLNEGIVELIKTAHDKNWAVVIVTNQSGLGREYYDWSIYDLVTQQMQRLLAAQGQWVDQIVEASYYSKSKKAYGLVRSGLRKPGPGMILKAAQSLRIDLGRSIMVGDRSSDIESGFRAGVKENYFLNSQAHGHEVSELKSEWKAQIIQRLQDIRLKA